MKYFFSEIDGITLTFGDIHNVKACEGFNENERAQLLDYARTNAFLIWEIAREGLLVKKGTICRG